VLHLIHNPVAGRGRGRDAARRASELLRAAHVEHRVWTTERPGHAGAIAASLPQDATVVAIGGDGTVHEILPACVGTHRTLGIVPRGSGDDFAHALGLPRDRVEPAVAALIAGRTRRVDSGVCNGEPFLNAVGTGLDAEVGARVVDAPAPLSGLGAYLWSVAVTLGGMRLGTIRVELDGALAFEGRSLLTSVQNGPRTGGSFHFAPAARIDDGRFAVIIAGDLTRLGTLALLPRVMVGRHLGHPKVHLFDATRVRIDWDAPRVWHAEGEIQSPVRSLEIAVRPASVRVLAP
jgi:YegS/Rv2252/BmrU family lipid kinase